MAEHSPTPWSVSPEDSREVIDARGLCVCDTVSVDPEATGRERANAAHIVAAVNAHGPMARQRDAMLAACRSAAAKLDALPLQERMSVGWLLGQEFAAIAAAIDLSEGDAP